MDHGLWWGISSRNVLRKHTALKRCNATEILCHRKEDSRGSPETRAIILPMVSMKEAPPWSTGPRVSKATGTTSYPPARSRYFSSFRAAADSAPLPGQDEVKATYEAASVSVTVTPHTAHFPLRHGISVRPSGRLPSDLDKPRGSFTYGMPALDRARHIMSFKLWWRITLPELRLQERQWIAVASTKAPQGHVCGSHSLAPRRRPTATRTASSSNRSPQEAIGRACSQWLLR